MLEGRDALPIVNTGDLVLEECAMLLIITAEHILGRDNIPYFRTFQLTLPWIAVRSVADSQQVLPQLVI